MEVEAIAARVPGPSRPNSTARLGKALASKHEIRCAGFTKSPGRCPVLVRSSALGLSATSRPRACLPAADGRGVVRSAGSYKSEAGADKSPLPPGPLQDFLTWLSRS